MDVSEYRRQYAEKIERAAQERSNRRLISDAPAGERRGALESAHILTREDEVAEATRIVESKEEDPTFRVSALQKIGIEVSNSHDMLSMAIGLLRDNDEPTEVRLGALRVLKQSSFRARIFDPLRPDYLKALREVVDAEDPMLRDQVIEVLAQEGDAYIQERLLEGLKDPSRALVPPERAIQLLGNDIHDDYYPVLEEIVKNPPSDEARQEAVRLMAAFPESRRILTSILRDKNESSRVRNTSAVALRSLAPAEFHEHAREIVLDDDEDDNLRASSITALTFFSTDREALSQDTEFNGRLERLRDEAPSSQSGDAAARFMSQDPGRQ